MIKVTWQDGSITEGVSAQDVVAKMAQNPWVKLSHPDPGNREYMRGVMRRAGVFTGIYMMVPVDVTPEWFLRSIQELGVAKVEGFDKSKG